MKRRLDSNMRSRITRCFAVIGRPITTLMADAAHFHCERWRNATMSPFFLRSNGNFADRLRAVESYFRRRRSEHPYDSAGAYANLLGVDSGSRDHRSLATARELGWTVDHRPYTINVWSARLPVFLAKPFHLVAGGYFDRTVYRGFRKTMIDNFGSTPRFMTQLDAMIRGIDERVRTTLIYHENGRIAGGGLVATNGNDAFLFAGSVCKPYRGRGLWKVLVAARQMVSAQQGAEFWITTTRTQRILGKGEFSFPQTILTKAAADRGLLAAG